MAMKFRNLQASKILNTNTNRIYPVPFEVMYISSRYGLKNNSTVYYQMFWVEVWCLQKPVHIYIAVGVLLLHFQ